MRERADNGPYADLADLCRRNDLSKLNKRVLEVLIMSGSLDGFGANRATLMANLPATMKAAEQETRDRLAGQSDMFGAPQAPVSTNLAAAPDWPLLERLRGERQTLGLYLTGHPLDPWRADLEKFTSGDIGGLADRFAQQLAHARGRQGPDAIVAGQVLSVRRRSERAAFVALDDQSGRIEAACFGDTLAEHADLLVPERLIVVAGTLVNDDFSGGQQLRAQKIFDIEDAIAHFARALRLQLDGTAADIDRIKALLNEYRPGSAPVWIRYQVADAVTHLELGADWTVAANRELIGNLESLPGVTGAQIEY